MTTTIKKILTFFMAAFFSVYCMIGLGNNVSDDYKPYKNVILMIGDGMGDNTLAATRQRYNTSLAMDKMPVYAHSDTRSFILDYTDSAAGGTALATGIRVWFNSVGRFPFYPVAPANVRVPISLTELAKNNGRSAGVVTTDLTSGATPSDFTAHALARQFETDISIDQLNSDFDLIWGCDSKTITKKRCEKHGFEYVSNKTEMMALESGSRSIAQFDFDTVMQCRTDNDMPTLTEMVNKAVDLLDDNQNGFFLMVEGACIDKYSHENDLDGATMNAMAFSNAVDAALDYAEKSGDTLVIVTADHETGGIKYNENTDSYYYTSKQHTTADVPLYVSAEDAGFTSGQLVENRQISVQIARIMGYGADQFPAVKGYSYEK